MAFVSGNLDMTFPYTLSAPVLRDVRSQVPQAICEVTPFGGTNNYCRDQLPRIAQGFDRLAKHAEEWRLAAPRED